MEQAVFVSKVENLKYCDEDFSRLYFGIEFCERLIPTVDALEEVFNFVDEQGKDLALVTPYVTEDGLEKVEKLLVMLAEAKPGSEVVFNDWGVFQVMDEKYPDLIPVLGRLLNKMKRGPRLLNVLDKIPEESVTYYRSPSITIPEIRDFLLKKGIGRVEFDNLLQGIDLERTGDEIRKSLYLPFAYITTTRLCLTALCDQPDRVKEVGILPCGHECQRYTFCLKNPIMIANLIRKGNTIFLCNEDIPDNLRMFDRVVIEPEIPI
ncbi:MAG TPA: hypothetical protein VMX95_06115 [Thermodesulfobacteriota bacterium]|nr:hypothetical protein [Thermodesulfobacteriota bacterium]